MILEKNKLMLMYFIISFVMTLFVSYMKSATNESLLLNMLLQIFIYGIPSFWIIKIYFPCSASKGTVPSSSDEFKSFLLVLYIGLFILFMYTQMTNLDNDTWIFLLNILIITPICEELYFRGFIYNYIKENFTKTSPLLASREVACYVQLSRRWLNLVSDKNKMIYPIFISAIIFSIYHLNPTTMLVAFVAGILLGYLYYRTKSLKLCIIIHSVYNLCVVLIINILHPPLIYFI